MNCPNCGKRMDTYFLSSSHLDHGCFNCGCIVDWETGLIVTYDDQRTYRWEQSTGRRRKERKDEISNGVSKIYLGLKLLNLIGRCHFPG